MGNYLIIKQHTEWNKANIKKITLDNDCFAKVEEILSEMMSNDRRHIKQLIA